MRIFIGGLNGGIGMSICEKGTEEETTYLAEFSVCSCV